MRSHHPFLWFALVLVVLWVVLHVALAVTSGLLHLLWIGAIIFAIIWVFRHLTGGRKPRV